MVPIVMVIIDNKFIYLGNSIFINSDMQINHEPQEMPAKPPAPASTTSWARVDHKEALTSFMEQTLLTLCLACKKVDEDMYEDWRQGQQEASILFQNWGHALYQVYEEISRTSSC
ncbi:Putative phospholipid-transporting ATPase IK [Myotis brandtii]|uniref:Putative phospholipid-transporting ATPase IK n=1 Tax=Myotis brandtii TaxID=109478 RepID=S7ML64_MYOBR|nr:Putative phospholipid-transporting ATPase IK [Myotis brandtii]